jgi:hypothetical protein
MTIDVDPVLTNGHVTVRLQGGQGDTRRFPEARAVEVKHTNQPLLHVLDHGRRRSGTSAYLPSSAQHTG